MLKEIIVSPERPDSPDCKALIDELQTHLASLYPPASQHGFSIQRLVDEQVAFFILRCDGAPVGCGGIKIYPEYGELKRIFIRPAYRGQGLSKRIMQHLEAHAVGQGMGLVRLETGIYQQEAITLYEHMGYQRVAPFGEYVYDPLSIYFEKILSNLESS